MNFHDLLVRLQGDLSLSLLGSESAPAGFQPELIVCATIVAMLLARMIPWLRWIDTLVVALVGAVTALAYAAPWQHLAAGASFGSTEIFDGLLVLDPLSVYFRGILLLFLVLFLIFTRLSGIPDREDAADIYSLVLGSTLGMMLMASANHLFTVFLAVEMASVPSYALTGVLKGRRTSSEAALKYAVYGAGAAGVMLYGISLLAGALGSFHLPTMASQLAHLTPDLLAERQAVLMTGGLMLMVGLAFKLSAVPFHFWCPDVFEGTAAEVNAFLSVASKAAALALLVRVVTGFTYLPVETPVENQVTQVAVASEPARDSEVAKVDPAALGVPEPLARSRRFIVGLLALIAAVTTTFGNLAAYGQKNLKRLLAYSTIAHAGFMIMPVAAAVSLLDHNVEMARQAIGAMCFYIGVYLFMNLGAFAVIAFLRNQMRSEELADYAGLIHRCPGVVICFGLILVSLLGLPPLSGFIAKLQVFYVLVADPALLTLLVIAGLNSVVSLFYYLGVVKVMTIDPEPADRLPLEFSMWSPAGVFLCLITLPVVVLGVWWDPLNRWAQAAARLLFT